MRRMFEGMEGYGHDRRGMGMGMGMTNPMGMRMGMMGMDMESDSRHMKKKKNVMYVDTTYETLLLYEDDLIEREPTQPK